MSGNDSRRSQAQAACNSCRKRKSRCKFDDTDQTVCFMCKMHGSECIFPESSAESSRSSPAVRRAHKLSARQNATASASPVPSSLGPDRGSSTQRMSSTAETGNARGPGVSTSLARLQHYGEANFAAQQNDGGILANYTTNDGIVRPKDNFQLETRPTRWYRGFASGRRPVLWNSLRQLPLGHVPASKTAESKCALITQLIEPFRKQILEVYFSEVHPSFPLLDKNTFLELYDTDKDKISPALLSALYAHAIVYWRSEHCFQIFCSNDYDYESLEVLRPTFAEQRYPDLRYVWDQANLALNSEMNTSWGVSTVVAILLNISGRPLTSMVRNKMLLSSAISLAHTLSLNRDSTRWSGISMAELHMRTRVWWAIVIYDKWLSVTHGTPPQLRATQYDVPKPPSQIDDDNGDAISQTFAALASLCDVLDTYLEYVFDLHNTNGGGNVAISTLIERQLFHWQDSLPLQIRDDITLTLTGRTTSAGYIPNGTANLRLAYLYVILIARKLGLSSTRENVDRRYDTTLRDYHLQQAVLAAEDIVYFVQNLKFSQHKFYEFYLPFAALCLSDTVAFLIRSALKNLEEENNVLGKRCLKLASDMITSLKDHRRIWNWDLGDICLARYAHVVEAMLVPVDESWEDNPEVKEVLLSDFLEVDQMAPELWDMYNGV